MRAFGLLLLFSFFYNFFSPLIVADNNSTTATVYLSTVAYAIRLRRFYAKIKRMQETASDNREAGASVGGTFIVHT